MDRPYYEYTKGELRDRIEKLERELAAEKEAREKAEDERDGFLVMLAEERDLSGRLAGSYAISLNDKAKVMSCPSLAAYRKARGL